MPQFAATRAPMVKIVVLVVLGLMLGALGGATLGVGAGIAWTALFETPETRDHSGVLMFFTLMPLGAVLGGVSGAALFGLMALRDGEIVIEPEPLRRPKS